MRFAVATVALFAASASAFNLVGRQDIPSCAGTCIASADLGGCSATDNACLCKSSTFVNSTSACIQKACQGAELAAAEQAAQSLCAAVGVTLSAIPTGSASATGSSPATASASGSASGSAPAASATKPAASSASKAGSTASSTGSAAPASSSKSAGSIVGVSSFAGLAAFGLAALTL